MRERAYRVPLEPSGDFLPTLDRKKGKARKVSQSATVAAMTVTLLGGCAPAPVNPELRSNGIIQGAPLELKEISPVDALIDCNFESGRKPEAVSHPNPEHPVETVRVNADPQHPAVITTNLETKGNATYIQAVNPDNELNISSNELKDPFLATVLVTHGDIFIPQYAQSGRALISCPADVNNAAHQEMNKLFSQGYHAADLIWLGTKGRLEQQRTGVIPAPIN